MVLATAEAAVVDAVESVAAALRVGVTVVTTPDAALAAWAGARVVLVGPDIAPALASEGVRRRPRAYLLGFDPWGVAPWSVALGAEVIVLPQAVAWLTDILGADDADACPVVAVVGGSGGAGASTLAAGLALAAAERGVASALVDADPVGGGLDLLLGAERLPGHRWGRMAGAQGEVGDVRGLLPRVEGVTLLSMARDAGELPGAGAVAAVTRSLARHHGLVVLDAGRTPWPAARALVRSAWPTMLVASAGVRAVASARAVVTALELDGAGVVVRAVPGVRVPPELVAEALGLELWGQVPFDRGVVAAAEAGEPPWLGRSRWGRAVAGLLETVLARAGDDDRS